MHTIPSIFLILLFIQSHECYHRLTYNQISPGILSSTFSQFRHSSSSRQLMQPKPREKTKGERKLLEKDISSSQIKVPSTDSSSLSKTSSTASASSASTPSLFSSVSSIIDTSEVDKIISSLPIADKYALLIQSYAGKILESSANTADGEKNDRDLLKKIELLYSEMILRSISPEKKSIQNMIDSSSSFGNVELFSKTLKLLKKGGNVRGFGVAVGQLTSPIFKDLNSTFFSTALPSDEREKEVTYAIGAIVFTLNWIGFQFVDFFVQDVSIYNTIISLLLGALLVYDVVTRKSEEIKMTVAGFERLLFRDNARQAFLDACSFVGGYLLGLPSYCYTSGVNEGLKMIETHPYSLQIYRQPSLLSSSLLNDLKKTFTSSFGNIDDKKRKGSNSLTSEEQFQKIVQQFKIRLAIGDKPDSLNVDLQSPASAVKSDSTNVKRLSGKEMVMMDALIENSLYDYLWEEEDRKFALGRILIWLMIPVAAETAKYGKTILTIASSLFCLTSLLLGQTMLSDPARGKKFLDSVLTILKSKKIPVDSFLQSTYASTATSYSFTSSNEVITKSSIEFSKIAELLPQNEKDQKALLEWAYYEASAMLRQYGELFEDIHDYLKTGTSTVGECTLLIEEKL